MIRRFLCLSLLATAIAFGQAAPSFEAAAIRPTDSLYLSARTLSGGRFTAESVTLRVLIEMAYSLIPFQLTGGPKWLDSQKFSVNAAGKETATNEQVRLMLRTLLAERFSLVLRSESREMPTYALMVKDAPKAKAKLTPSEPGVRPGFSTSTSGRGAETNHVAFRSYSMLAYAGALSRELQRMVFDETGLEGEFDFQFDATREEGEPNPFVVPWAPSLGDLGLKIESRRGPVQIYVVDRAEMPSEN